MPPLRLFFALWPDEAARASLVALSGALHVECGGRRMAPEKLHVTLAFLGAVDGERTDALIHAMEGFQATPFDCVFDQLRYWKDSRVAWAGMSGTPVELTALAAVLRQRLLAGGAAFDPKPFVPHVTLLRDARRPQASHDFPPVRWRANEMCLVRSLNGRYETLARWSLTGHA